MFARSATSVCGSLRSTGRLVAAWPDGCSPGTARSRSTRPTSPSPGRKSIYGIRPVHVRLASARPARPGNDSGGDRPRSGCAPGAPGRNASTRRPCRGGALRGPGRPDQARHLHLPDRSRGDSAARRSRSVGPGRAPRDRGDDVADAQGRARGVSSEGLTRGDDGVVRCFWGDSAPEYRSYHDTEWGFPVDDSRRLFEKLSLEGFQSGLSWLTILRKREGFRRAFAGFETSKVARFGARDVERLMADASIVRNRAKIEATIANARATIAVQERHGSLAALMWSFEPPARSRRV